MTNKPEDRAPIIYGERHRYITIDTESLSANGILILPGGPPAVDPLSVRDHWTTGPGSKPNPDWAAESTAEAARPDGVHLSPDGLRIDTEGDDPDPEFPEISGRLVRTLRRLFDDYGAMGTIMVAAKISPAEPEPEPEPERTDVDLAAPVQRGDLAAVMQHLATLGEAFASALAQVRTPEVTISLSEESLARLDQAGAMIARATRQAARQSRGQ